MKSIQENLPAHAFRTLSYAAEHRNDFVCSLSGFESKTFRASLAALDALGYLEDTPESEVRYPYHVPKAPEVPLAPAGLKARDIVARFRQDGVPLSEFILKPKKLTKRVFSETLSQSRWEGACCDESGKPWVTNGYFLFRSTKKEWAQFGVRPNGSPSQRAISNIIKHPKKATFLRPYRTDGTTVSLKARNGFRDCRISVEIYRLVLHRYPDAKWRGSLYIPFSTKTLTWDYIYIFDKGKLVGVCMPTRN